MVARAARFVMAGYSAVGVVELVDTQDLKSCSFFALLKFLMRGIQKNGMFRSAMRVGYDRPSRRQQRRRKSFNILLHPREHHLIRSARDEIHAAQVFVEPWITADGDAIIFRFNVTGLAISDAPSGIRAMRRRAAFSWLSL